MSPVFFEDLPQGTPSVSPVATTATIQAGYCGPSDVAALVRSRSIGVGANQPTIIDIDSYIVMIAGQMDAVMLNKGYQVPVNTASFPEVEGFLGWVNATGAAWMMEVSAPTSVEVDRLKDAFDGAMSMLVDGKFAMDVPTEETRSEPRAPFITYTPPCEVFDPTISGGNSGSGDGISGFTGRSGDRKLPYLSRSLRF